jgi:hypothetical protein
VGPLRGAQKSTIRREKATLLRRKSTNRMSFRRPTKMRFSRVTKSSFCALAKSGHIPGLLQPEPAPPEPVRSGIRTPVESIGLLKPELALDECAAAQIPWFIRDAVARSDLHAEWLRGSGPTTPRQPD